MNRKDKGFTLVEILIVVIILGILAAIVIPQFTEASNDARKSALRSDLQTMRSQLELYKVQHLDTYPDVNDEGEFETQMTTKTDQDGGAGGTLGPYLQKIPTNPFNSSSTIEVSNAAPTLDGADGWHYNPDTGAFTANTTDFDLHLE